LRAPNKLLRFNSLSVSLVVTMAGDPEASTVAHASRTEPLGTPA
jgi:hypothetical protein